MKKSNIETIGGRIREIRLHSSLTQKEFADAVAYAEKLADEELKLDDEIDDTFGEIPDGYIIGDVKVEETKEDDEWLF